MFTLKPDHELPDGVARADFCGYAISSAVATSTTTTSFDVPMTEEDERAAKRLRGGLQFD